MNYPKKSSNSQLFAPDLVFPDFFQRMHQSFSFRRVFRKIAPTLMGHEPMTFCTLGSRSNTATKGKRLAHEIY
jgi:hypothetical protein